MMVRLKGRASGMSDDDIIAFMVELMNISPDDARTELEKGVHVELEHTLDPETARLIARDHILEFPDYYYELDEMERRLDEKWDSALLARTRAKYRQKKCRI